MIAALTSGSMSDAAMVVSPITARAGDAGFVTGCGDGAAAAGVAVGDGFGAAVLEAGGRRGVCAVTTMKRKAAANAAGISLRRFIKDSFLRGARANPSRFHYR